MTGYQDLTTRERKRADSLPPKPQYPARPPHPQLPRASSRPIAPRRRGSASRVLVTTLLAVLTAIFVLALAWWFRTPQFPPPRLAAPRPRPTDASSILPPRPAAPSVPGLQKLLPTPIPGLDLIGPAFSPCLSDDLCTIVYCGPRSPRARYDLFIARRDEPAQPFQTRRVIGSCASADADVRPSLSPDALRLVFIRSDEKPQLFYTSRPTAADDFAQPVPLELEDVQTAGRIALAAQFLGTDEMVVRLRELATDNRSIYLFRSSERQHAFGTPRLLPVSNSWLPHVVAPGSLRTYYGTTEGIFASGRSDPRQPFSPGAKLIDASVTGPIDGPIWVAPKEDLVVYCSPGPGKPMGSARKLWMISF